MVGSGLRIVIIRLVIHDERPVLYPIHIAHEEISGLTPHKFRIVLVPAVRNCRSVCNDQDFLCLCLKNEIIDRERLPESGLRIPEKLPALMVIPIGHRLPDGLGLLITKHIRNDLAYVVDRTAAI